MKNIILLLVVFYSVVKCQTQFDSNAVALNTEAMHFYFTETNKIDVDIFDNKEKQKKILDLLSQAIEKDSTYYIARGNMANYLFLFGRYDECIKQNEKLLKMNPDYAEGYWRFGLIYDKMNKPILAGKYYQKALKILDKKIMNVENPEDLYLKKCIVLYLLGKDNEASELINMLKEKYAKDTDFQIHVNMYENYNRDSIIKDYLNDRENYELQKKLRKK